VLRGLVPLPEAAGRPLNPLEVEALLAGVSEAACRARLTALSSAPPAPPPPPPRATAPAPPPPPAFDTSSLGGRIAAHTARSEEAARGAAAARVMEGIMGRFAPAAGGGGAHAPALPAPAGPVKPLSALVQEDFTLAGFQQYVATPANLPSMGAVPEGASDSEGEAPLSKEELRRAQGGAKPVAPPLRAAQQTDLEQLE
jgi:hypothetical protein